MADDPAERAPEFTRLYQRTLDLCPNTDVLDLVVLAATGRGADMIASLEMKHGDVYVPRPIEHIVKDIVAKLLREGRDASFEAALTQLEEGKFSRRTPTRATSAASSTAPGDETYKAITEAVLGAIPTKVIEEHLKQRKQQTEKII